MEAAPFTADLDPKTRRPRIRFNFANGWTASMLIRTHSKGCDAYAASLAAWPTGKVDRELAELGPTEASPDEAASWIDDIRCRDARP